jgi:CHAT domain-containing protein
MNARAEVDAISAPLGQQIVNRGTISDLPGVSDLMLSRDLPSIIHFAGHITFSNEAGPSISLEGGLWEPSDLALAVVRTSLAQVHPLVFLNACRSAGEIPWVFPNERMGTRVYRGWCGRVHGSLWAVRSSSAGSFAEVFYEQLVCNGQSLGSASLAARTAVSQEGGDPTWLAYSVYGNARRARPAPRYAPPASLQQPVKQPALATPVLPHLGAPPRTQLLVVPLAGAAWTSSTAKRNRTRRSVNVPGRPQRPGLGPPERL